LVIGTVFLIFGLWLLIRFADQTTQVLTILALSILLATALRPAVDRMTSNPLPLIRVYIPKPLAILFIYLVLSALLVGIGFLVIPNLVQETRQFIASVPAYVDVLNGLLQGSQSIPFLPRLGALEEQLSMQLISSLSQAVNVLLFALQTVVSLLSFGVVLVITFFLIMDADQLYCHILNLVPPARREQVQAMTEEMGQKVEGWLKGVFLLSVFIGVATGLGMWALGMPYPVLLGLAAGLFELVPLIGPYIGAAPAVIVALFQGPWTLAVVVVFYVVLQQVENNILAPAIIGHEADLPPLLAVVSLLLGAALLGILGALLALPVAAVLQVLWLRLVVPEIRERYHER